MSRRSSARTSKKQRPRSNILVLSVGQSIVQPPDDRVREMCPVVFGPHSAKYPFCAIDEEGPGGRGDQGRIEAGYLRSGQVGRVVDIRRPIAGVGCHDCVKDPSEGRPSTV
jgi:hypothetical protein